MNCIFNTKTLDALLMLTAEKCKTIKSIEVLRDINFNDLDDDCFQKFCDIFSQSQDLEKIYFHPGTFNNLSLERLEALMKALLSCRKLKEIILESSCIGEWDNERLKMLGKWLSRLETLQVLRLGNNVFHKLEPLGCQALFGFLSLSSITELYLEGNDIGLFKFACLIEAGKVCAQIKSLKLLHLGYNKLDELGIPGFEAFFRPLASSSITVLDLTGNGLGNANLASQCFTILGAVCGKLKNLQILSLAQNRFNQLKEPCFLEFAEGITRSSTLCEIEAIHSFNKLHQKALNGIITRNQESQKENQPPENKLEQETLKQEGVFFVHGCSLQPKPCITTPEKNRPALNPVDTNKRLKTE